ncbi:hypothetical protein FXV83_00385 [Bradyrhizobium hipponense]|uniref:Uncharacterized protein n=1 Tax=Bradyrhizobium hipponense TaxID=2605638 RepID=A0A5S4YY12_9BRAD|nr:hypothetical protein [Bradyrhizobium hipponense]TYO68494.1 hypothetical protein FXV83_00385 [Bradyrhizobium hipponense]
MATLSQLIAAIAAAEGIDAERVTAIGRAVREHGLVRTSGRGTSAAQMEERDAANLLIATNTADTARTAPAAVLQYRALQAKRDKRTSEFGSELEELISAAKREVLADYVTKMIAVVGARGHILGKRRYPNEAYQFELTFEKPIPSVFVHIGASHARPDVILFSDRREPPIKAGGDRRESTRITQRTILAVANVLRT